VPLGPTSPSTAPLQLLPTPTTATTTSASEKATKQSMKRPSRTKSKTRSGSYCLRLVLLTALIQLSVFYAYLWSVPPAAPTINFPWREGVGMERFPEGGNMTEWINRYSRSNGYTPFPSVSYEARNDGRQYTRRRGSPGQARFVTSSDPSKAKYNTQYTMQELTGMGVNLSSWDTWITDKNGDSHKFVLDEHLPPWIQILDNYGNGSVIVGKERCAAYRNAVPVAQRLVAPVGLFSSGTNILHDLLLENCVMKDPNAATLKERRRRRPDNQPGVFLWQPPWGKHNPVAARMKHLVPLLAYRNQSAVFPVVTIRHPFTWMLAVCRHPYSLQWDHNLQACDRSLFLDNPLFAQFGALHAEQNYTSLVHLWTRWYSDFMQSNDFPLLIVRLEDLIYRPKPVVIEICQCVGGTPRKKFHYQIESANVGRGHGEHRSSLVTAFVKFGKPLEIFPQYYFSSKDWEIIDSNLKAHSNATNLLDAFHYNV